MTHECKALCKWGLQYALQMDLVKFPLLHQKNLSFIFNDLMESLKSIYVFNCDDNVQHGNPPVVYSMLESFFVNLVKNSNDEQKRFVFSKVIFCRTFMKDLNLFSELLFVNLFDWQKYAQYKQTKKSFSIKRFVYLTSHLLNKHKTYLCISYT